ncbi:MAG: S1C family serine protease [Clostridiales bacterium]|jgi:S1-C subfamily serine protease|nr:S1C family serine protease [Clostridiales bacterium]
MDKKFCNVTLVIVFICFTVILLSGGIFKEYTSIEICKEFLSAVVEIKICDENQNVIGNATGTVISREGLILTNRHIVQVYDYSMGEYVVQDNVYVGFFNETEYMLANIVSCGIDSDLALLKIERTTKNYIKMSKSEVGYGDEIHTIGNGNGFGLAYAKGYVASALVRVLYDGNSVEAIQLSLNINEGNSGGSLINGKGQLIGIITFRLRDNQGNVIHGTSFALPLGTIKTFLQSI